jgi:hypothetical protein
MLRIQNRATKCYNIQLFSHKLQDLKIPLIFSHIFLQTLMFKNMLKCIYLHKEEQLVLKFG